jgi:hypothetical protein
MGPRVDGHSPRVPECGPPIDAQPDTRVQAPLLHDCEHR